MATPTNTGVRFKVEVWCDVKTGQVSVVGAEPTRTAANHGC